MSSSQSAPISLHPLRYWQLSVAVQLVEALVRVASTLQHYVTHWKSSKRWNRFQSFKHTCTDKLQIWNQSRPWKLDSISVENLCTRKQELMPLRKRSVQLTCVSAEFDPHLKPPNPTATEQLWCNLLALNKPCPFLLLFPDIKKVWHDHLYPRFLHPVNLHHWSISERTKYCPCLHCSSSRHRYTY